MGRLVANATTIINAEDYGRIIYELALRRALIFIGEEMVNAAYDADVDEPPNEQIERAEQLLYEVAETGKYGQGFETFSSAMATSIEMAHAAQQRGGHSGLATGLLDLDEMMGGLHPSDLIILAGRPSMGKTALATNIAFNIARAFRVEQQETGEDKTIDGAKVAFFSLEMSSEQLATRILSEQAEVPSDRIRRGRINEDDFRRLLSTSHILQDLPLFIDQTGGNSDFATLCPGTAVEATTRYRLDRC